MTKIRIRRHLRSLMARKELLKELERIHFTEKNYAYVW